MGEKLPSLSGNLATSLLTGPIYRLCFARRWGNFWALCFRTLFSEIRV